MLRGVILDLGGDADVGFVMVRIWGFREVERQRVVGFCLMVFAGFIRLFLGLCLLF